MWMYQDDSSPAELNIIRPQVHDDDEDVVPESDDDGGADDDVELHVNNENEGGNGEKEEANDVR